MFEKLKGGQALPPRPNRSVIIKTSLFGLIAIAIVAGMAQASAMPLILGSFGASCVILGFPDSPFAQPRNVILGHLVSSAIGLLCLTLFGPQWWSMAIAVSLAIGSMHGLGVVHPPAGSNPVIVMLAQPGWGFLLFPTLTGAVLLIMVALIYHNGSADKSYPRYW
jgi:CBS-domain-containing membrane protein